MIMAIKKAEKSDAYVVRVREIAAASSSVSLIFGNNIISAQSTNGMEDDSGATALIPGGANNNEIAFSINKYQLKTFKVFLGNSRTVASRARLGSIPSIGDRAFTLELRAGGKRSLRKFIIPVGETVRKAYVTDLRGRMIRLLYDEPAPLTAAWHLAWNGADREGRIVSSGVYAVTVETDNVSQHALLHWAQ
jgi:hypothetical protein